MVAQSAVEKLGTSLRGAVICAGHIGYDAARTIHNRTIDRRPAVIARCAGAADVVESVRFAREQDLLVSVRGGGHSIAGKAVCDGGLMIEGKETASEPSRSSVVSRRSHARRAETL